MKNKAIRLLLVLTAVFGSMVALANNQLDAEIKKYQAAFQSGSYTQMREALSEMQWKGITDRKVYDALLEQFKKSQENTSKSGLDQTAHLAKGLALSGDDKYKKIIESELADVSNNKLNKHYMNAIKLFDDYARWNPVIAANLQKSKDINIQRVKNMLLSDMADMQTIGAKRVYWAYYSENELLDVVSKRLLEISGTADDRQSIDAGAWMCKALSKSGKVNYKQALEKVAETASHKKLRKYAKKYAATL